MNHLRVIKVILVACVALFAGLVAFNNIVDYGSNYAFVQHVLTMDSIFNNNPLIYRSIQTPFLHHAFYWLIIFTEAMVGILCALGVWQMWHSRLADNRTFDRAKKWANIGLVLGVLLWFTGFMTIGAEWFLMWQSKIWNGQSSAFCFIVVVFLVLIFINQEEKAY